MAFGRKKREEEAAATGGAEQAQAGDEAATVVESDGEQPADAGTAVQSTASGGEAHGAAGPGADDGATPRDEIAQAAASAGDPAAAATDAAGPGADAGAGAGYEVATSGTSAASPDTAAIPAATGGAWSGPGAEERPEPAPERVQGVVEERPEVLVAGAFLGGVALARLLAALGDRR